MTSFKEAATAYQPKHTKNIVELEAVSIEQSIKTETRKGNDGEPYQISFVVVEGNEYRVPPSVIEQVQTILLAKPDLKTFKVTKKGEGLNTKYTVVQLE